MQRYVEVKPCSLPDNGEYAVWLKVGNQSFQLAGEFPKEDAGWMKGMLVKALDHIHSDARAVEEERDALRADNKLLELYLSNTRKDKEVLAADVSDLNASRDDVIQANKALTADLTAAKEQITHLLEDSDGLAKLYAKADGKLAKAREALERLVNDLESVHNDPEYQCVWTLYQTHVPTGYGGRKYTEALDNAKALIAQDALKEGK